MKWKTVPSGSSKPRLGPNCRNGTPAARSAASAVGGSGTRSATWWRIAGISAGVVSMKTGCPSANRDKVSGGPTGSSDEEPQRREEQPDEKVLRWTGRSQQEQRVRDRGRGGKGDRAWRGAHDAGRVLGAAGDVSACKRNSGCSGDRDRGLLCRPSARSAGARSHRGRCARGAAQGTPTQPEERWA